jgi:citrate lyase subunit beta/citryl-CoA lyase
VETVASMHWLDTMLTQLEHSEGLPLGAIGIEAQIEGPSGLAAIDAIAAASDRLETLVFGPGDFSAAMKMPSLSIGAADSFDPFDSVRMEIVMAARRRGVQAIDGPFSLIRDLDGYTRSAARAATCGFDGKWVLHPGQLPLANEAFTPAQDAYDRAEYMLEAYAHATSASGGALGAIMVGEDMVDEASAKMAMVIAERGRVLGMTRTTRFEPQTAMA